jgi:uncharacterized protein YndB with AHSA1/START domain
MNKDLKVFKSIEINASADEVWDALTNPKKISIYLYGTETITDWKEGSSIVFQGEYDGHQYKDKGLVKTNRKNELLKYDYWSGFSGLEDKPENYSTVSYIIEPVSDGKVKFTWMQEGFSSEEGQKHSDNGLYSMLEQIKELVENK